MNPFYYDQTQQANFPGKPLFRAKKTTTTLKRIHVFGSCFRTLEAILVSNMLFFTVSQCVCLRVLTFEGRSEGGVRKAGQEVAVGRFLGQAGSKSGQGVAMVTELLQRNPFPQVGL